MSFRAPQSLNAASFRFETGASILDAEIASEKASSLGRMGARVNDALARLAEAEAAGVNDRDELLRDAADAVWMFFVQREACGIRDQGPAIRDLKIPRAVLVRLGAR